jgi:predicted transcriptional regulator
MSELWCITAIIVFLGYNPLPEATTLADRLVRHRTSLGMTQKEAAAEIGVDQGTSARWERGERAPTGVHLADVQRFLDLALHRSTARRAG